MTSAVKVRRAARPTGTALRFSVAELKAAFNAIKDAVPSRPLRPILANVLIGSDETISATDLELRITYPLRGATGPAVLLPHARLMQILNSCKQDDEVSLQVDGSRCVVECGDGRWTLPTESVADFPDAHEGIGKPISRLPADQFVTMMESVKFAADTKSGRPALAGVHIEFTANKDSDYGQLAFVATDGRRLCCATCEVEQDLDNSKTLVPKRAVDIICKLAASRNAVQLESAGNELLANIDGVVVQARLVEGTFPDWRKVTPERDVELSVADVSALLHAARMAAICASESSKGTRVVVGDNGMTLTSSSSEYGQSSARCELREVGNRCGVEVDPAFAIEWLESLDLAAAVDIDVESSSTAVVLRCEDSYTVIMPLARD